MSPNEATTNTNVTPTLPNEARPAKPASFIITVVLSIVLILTVSATILIIVNAIKSYNNPPAPDQARVKSYCISHGLQYTLVENGGALGDFADISKNLGGVSIKEVALCLQTATIDSPQDEISYSSISSSPDPFIISVYFLSDSYKGPASSNLSSAITEAVKLEDSESLFKGVDYYGQNSYKYTLMYQNTVIVLGTKSTDTGERTLAELGYPNRSHANPKTVDESLAKINNSKDDRNRNALRELVSALTKYQNAHGGKLPTVDSDSNGIEADVGIVSLDTEYATFLQKYAEGQDWFVDYSGHPFHSFDVSVKANLEEANKSINIVVHHNSTCNQTGELSAANASHFAVTYRKASGKGYICESNK